MGILFESFTGNDGDIVARLPLRATLTDAASFFRSTINLCASLAGGPQVGSMAVAARLPVTVRFTPVENGFFAGRYSLDSSFSADVLAPSVAVFAGSTPLPTVEFAGTETNNGDVTARFPLAARLAPGNVFAGKVTPQAYFSDGLASIDRSGFLLQQPQIIAHGIPGLWVQYVESLNLSGVDASQHVMVRTSHLGMSGKTLPGMLDALALVVEELTFSDVTHMVWNFLYQEALAMSDTEALSAGYLVEVAETLALAAGDQSTLLAMNAVVEALKLGDLAGHVWPATITEVLALGDIAGEALLALVIEQERLALGASAVGSASFTVLVPETLSLGADMSSTAELAVLIEEGLSVLVNLNLPDGKYLAWVCNTASRAFSTYRNFPFNSFCELDGHYYGATDTGIYLLEGDDDDGVPIDAHIRGGLWDMASGLAMRMDSVYLGYRSNGDLVLKVVTTSDGGEKAETWYSVEARTADAMREGRVKVGKGLKSVYWGFELANVNGADFETDKISFHPLVLERRLT